MELQMEKSIKKCLAVILCLCMLLGLTACGGDSDTGSSVTSDTGAKQNDTGSSSVSSSTGVTDNTPSVSTGTDAAGAVPGSWSIYWYLCGSDLETESACGTIDMLEMFDVELPENVRVIIQTGGACQWQNEFVDENKLCRYVYEGSDLFLDDSQPSASMGDPQTLYDFIKYADAAYPAEHKALIFWNHGGGSLDGAAFDELYDYDSITLPELRNVLGTMYGETSSIDSPAFDLIGFDTCLMSTIDVAASVKDYAKYLVASEETEPGNGWYYTGWLGDLAANPSMDGAQLGKSICDSFYEGCEMAGTESETTLAVTDLSKIPAVLEAYDAYADECLVLASQDPGFFADFYRSAASSENYGGNTKEQGYTDMVDLGHLAKNTASYISSSAAFLEALEAANVYKINGKYRAQSTGLSGFYAYDGSLDSLWKFNDAGISTPFKYLFQYGLTGETDSDIEQYIANLDIATLPVIETLEGTDWEGAKFDLNDEGSAFIDLGESAADIISDMCMMLFNIDEENDLMLFMGEDKNIICDWDNGIFTENFYGTWGCLDDVPVYMECTYGDDEYNLYSVPILLNGEEYNLQVAYTFDDGQYYILGARQGIDDSGMASKELRQLEIGDTIDIIWQLTDSEGRNDFEMYPVYTFVVDENLEFTDGDLTDGEYGLLFRMNDAYGNECMTDVVFFDIIDGEIITSVFAD